MNKRKLVLTILILSLFINVCSGLYFAPRVFSIINKSSNEKNLKYEARVSTFKLNTSETDIVFVGDSITAYIDWNEFFPSSNLLNRGIEGDTWGGGTA